MTTLLVPSGYASIQAAVNAAQSGDTIIVSNPLSGSSYNEQVDVINKNNIRIKANGNFVLDGSTPTSYNYGFKVFSDNVVIEGFTIQNYADNGIWIDGNNNTVTKCILMSFTNEAIVLSTKDNNNITKNTIENPLCIQIQNSSNNHIISNIIACETFGILLQTSSNSNLISKNEITSSNYGIQIYYSYSNIIRRNFITAGIDLAIVQFNSSSNDLIKNTIVVPS